MAFDETERRFPRVRVGRVVKRQRVLPGERLGEVQSARKIFEGRGSPRPTRR
jgi:hypothetical protein